ncbi:hypothetical protein Plhal304r1_c006g0023911 [Plasmopara halstedii]
MTFPGTFNLKRSGDCESRSSSEANEQVFEISTRSRIFISPRNSRQGRNLSSYRKNSANLNKQETTRGWSTSPGTQSRCQTFREMKANKSYWTHDPCESRAKHIIEKSDDTNSISEDESDGDSDDLCNDNDASFDADIEIDVPRRLISKHHSRICKKKRTKECQVSLQSLASPTTSEKELKELKLMLKKLAQDDDCGDSVNIQKEPVISSANTLRDLTAASGASNAHAAEAMNSLHPTKKSQMKKRNAVAVMPQSNIYTVKSKVKSTSEMTRKAGHQNNARRCDLPYESTEALDSWETFVREHRALNNNVFCSPPSPFRKPKPLTYPPQDTFSIRDDNARGGGMQGSCAVLSALKALQDKVNCLENEREDLTQQLSDAQLSERKSKAKLLTTRKKFSNELALTKESGRAAYDTLRNDNEELKLQLMQAEKRREDSQIKLNHFQELAQNLSTKVDDLQSQLKNSESRYSRVKADSEDSKRIQREAVDKLQRELIRMQQNQQENVKQFELLEIQFRREVADHAESKKKLQVAEETVALILQINETLVAKLERTTEAVNEALKRNSVLEQQTRESTLLQSTAACQTSPKVGSEIVTRRAASTSIVHGGNRATSIRSLKKKRVPSDTIASTTTKRKGRKASTV